MKTALFGFIAGVVVTVLGAPLVSLMVAPRTWRLTAPIALCDGESTTPCHARGRLEKGTVLSVDTKGYAHIFVRIEPGVPRGLEETDAGVTHFAASSVVDDTVRPDVPLLGRRDYSEEAVAVTGDEAVVLALAASAALEHLRAAGDKTPSLSNRYATVERRAPSAWVVDWGLNSAHARGGGIEVTIDPTGTRVIAVRDIE